MKIVATPSFSEKIAAIGPNSFPYLSSAFAFLEKNDRTQLEKHLVLLTGKEEGVYVLVHHGLRIFLSFGHDKDGEYVLLADLAFSDSSQPSYLSSNGQAMSPTEDPRRNINIDPNRNMTIDPRRNMTIDPNRNMTIDPNRNMTIDPRRNMTIDPNRNMTIDPNRNMMIDPRRNRMLNPKANTFINPNMNSVWSGTYLYSIDGLPTGYFVRASEKVALLFNHSADFVGFSVPANSNFNLFNPNGEWVAFFARTDQGGFNQFDTSCRWMGFTTREIL
ncbi:hypothetical protein PsAD46_01435 [Pseudovibrio sp. Ad46]|uniref:hypothetical protein n=1 Tax=Pseudovibrio sp. Ad46 TaxID=989432 RepID=UPI0007AE8FB0|nr:hypothetical protein [Pseudovibrio sp. Ad46]KZK91907.1 hypothetical protein PsAD46_01435 [Pseudovibrio sp. Ad46]